MSRALGRGGLAHPPNILVVFVMEAARGRPRRTRLLKTNDGIANITQKRCFYRQQHINTYNIMKSNITRVFMCSYMQQDFAVIFCDY